MNLKKSLLAILAAFIISNILTTIWYMLSNDANFVPFRRAEINYLGLLLNHLIFATGFVYLFPFYYERYKKLSHAFLYGVLMAAIMFIPTGFVVRSIWQVDFNGIFLMNTVAHLCIGGIMGMMTGVIYNYKNK